MPSLSDYARTGLRQYQPRHVAPSSVGDGWFESPEGRPTHALTGATVQPWWPQFEQSCWSWGPKPKLISDATRRRLAFRAEQELLDAQRAAVALDRARARQQQKNEKARLEAKARGKHARRQMLSQAAHGAGRASLIFKQDYEDKHKLQLARVDWAAQRIQAVARGRSSRQLFTAQCNRPIRVMVLLGGPGTGKSTLARRLVAEIGPRLAHLSVGELLHQACDGPAALRHKHAESIRVRMADGEHVSDELVLDVLGTAIRRLRFKAAVKEAAAAATTTAAARNCEENLQVDEDAQVLLLDNFVRLPLMPATPVIYGVSVLQLVGCNTCNGICGVCACGIAALVSASARGISTAEATLLPNLWRVLLSLH